MMRRVPLSFVKYHGLGNDFVVVEGPLVDADRARRICDRHRGVGADGLVTILPPVTPGAAAFMHIFNSDGSVAAMCGNAIRCLARHLVELGRASGPTVVIDTASGPKACTVDVGADGAVTAISVEMGPARLLGETDFAVDGEVPRAIRVSMGNPHAVLLEVPTRARAAALGPRIERMVPGGVNVGFARPGPDGIDLVVWERGAGLTDACGTGACAATVAAASRGLVVPDAPVAVRLPGGTLEITVARDLAGVTMRGPAQRVFAGEADL
jgi:diaminopimelate epimerase